jgi:cathepsin B
MKTFALIATILVAFAAVQINQRLFHEEEYHVRLGKIADQINSMGTSWKAHASGRFHKATLEQVKSLMGTKMDKDFGFPNANVEGIQAPDSFDSRQQWPNCASIQEVRDQSTCGSCWAFGAVEAMSDRLCIASGQQDQTRISSEDLLECCYSCGQGCNGGYPGAAWSYFKNTGIVSGDLYGDTVYCKAYVFPPCAHHVTTPLYPPCGPSQPTPACKKQCSTTSGRTYSSDGRKSKSVYNVHGESTMMAEVSTKGPFEIAMTVYEDFLTYKSGVYVHKTGNALGGHAMKLIGYGTENNLKYWLITNSWNPSWGDNGYIKIIRGINECGIEAQGVAGDL